MRNGIGGAQRGNHIREYQYPLTRLSRDEHWSGAITDNRPRNRQIGHPWISTSWEVGGINPNQWIDVNQ
jgi:hypothetical protein